MPSTRRRPRANSVESANRFPIGTLDTTIEACSEVFKIESASPKFLQKKQVILPCQQVAYSEKVTVTASATKGKNNTPTSVTFRPPLTEKYSKTTNRTNFRTRRRRHSVDESSSQRKMSPSLITSLQHKYDPEGDGRLNEPELYSNTSLLRRESIKFSPSVLTVLSDMWDLVDDDCSGTLEFSEYTTFHRKMALCLSHDTSPIEREAMCARDWAKDTGNGRKTIVRATFYESMFELADHWTDEIKTRDYETFLRGLLESISIDGRYRADDEVIRKSAPQGTSPTSNGSRRMSMYSLYSENGDTIDEAKMGTHHGCKSTQGKAGPTDGMLPTCTKKRTRALNILEKRQDKNDKQREVRHPTRKKHNNVSNKQYGNEDHRGRAKLQHKDSTNQVPEPWWRRLYPPGNAWWQKKATAKRVYPDAIARKILLQTRHTIEQACHVLVYSFHDHMVHLLIASPESGHIVCHYTSQLCYINIYDSDRANDYVVVSSKSSWSTVASLPEAWAVEILRTSWNRFVKCIYEGYVLIKIKQASNHRLRQMWRQASEGGVALKHMRSLLQVHPEGFICITSYNDKFTSVNAMGGRRISSFALSLPTVRKAIANYTRKTNSRGTLPLPKRKLRKFQGERARPARVRPEMVRPVTAPAKWRPDSRHKRKPPSPFQKLKCMENVEKARKSWSVSTTAFVRKASKRYVA